MRTGAEVCELPLAEEADDSILGKIVYEFCLIRLAHFFRELQRFFAGKSEALELDIFLYNLFHLSFDF